MSKLPELRINQKINRGYGWKRGAPNLFAPVFSSAFAGELPEKVDLQNLCPPVYDQGPLGSCTAQTVAAHAEISQAKLGKKSIISSFLSKDK